ncbi:hypothetical protein SO802_015664 [Lithocarpus litseifolius]|uniref:Uncharacterized protein n=1 Tax=Lithocarpus litseifolius TaxID=425828 RepID=A0AAW2CWP8_9ROSI
MRCKDDQPVMEVGKEPISSLCFKSGNEDIIYASSGKEVQCFDVHMNLSSKKPIKVQLARSGQADFEFGFYPGSAIYGPEELDFFGQILVQMLNRKEQSWFCILDSTKFKHGYFFWFRITPAAWCDVTQFQFALAGNQCLPHGFALPYMLTAVWLLYYCLVLRVRITNTRRPEADHTCTSIAFGGFVITVGDGVRSFADASGSAPLLIGRSAASPSATTATLITQQHLHCNMPILLGQVQTDKHHLLSAYPLAATAAKAETDATTSAAAAAAATPCTATFQAICDARTKTCEEKYYNI